MTVAEILRCVSDAGHLYDEKWLSNQPPSYTPETAKRIETLWTFAGQLAAIPINNDKKLWLWDDRGELPEHFPVAYRNAFSGELAWYRLTFRQIGEYRMLLLNGDLVQAEPFEIEEEDHFNAGCNASLQKLLQWMIVQVERCIRMQKDGSYEDWINADLPYRCRCGTICRKDLWEIYPEMREKILRDLTQDELEEFLRYLETPVPETAYLQDMTAADYYDICAICYRAIQAEGYDTLSPKEQFCRHHEGRDGHLRQLPDNDPKAFAEWAVRRVSHQFEICNVWLTLAVRPEEKGTHLMLSGSVELHMPELVRIMIALRQSGVPVTFCDGQMIAEWIREQDRVALYPGIYIAESYDRKNAPGTNIKTCGLPPDERFEELIRRVDWEPIPPSSRFIGEESQ